MGTHYKHLTMDERHTINRRRLEGASLHAVARELNRPASTVARAVAGNQTAVRYDAVAAPRCYQLRRPRGRRKLAPGTALWHGVVARRGDGPLSRLVAGANCRLEAPDESARTDT